MPVYTVLVGTEQGVVEEELPGGLRTADPGSARPGRAEARGRRSRAASSSPPTDDEGLKQVYEELGSRLGHRDKSREVTDVFAGGSAALLLAGGLLSALWFRRVP